MANTNNSSYYHTTLQPRIAAVLAGQVSADERAAVITELERSISGANVQALEHENAALTVPNATVAGGLQKKARTWRKRADRYRADLRKITTTS